MSEVAAQYVSRGDLLAAARQASQSDPTADLETGLVSAILRQLVTTRGTVARSRVLGEVAELLDPLLDAATPELDLFGIVEGELDALLSLGDLVLRQPAPHARILVEPATPSFVRLAGDARELLLLGGSYDGRPMLPARILEQLQVRGRARWLAAGHGEAASELVSELEWLGLREIEAADWTRCPTPRSADTVISGVAEQARPCAFAGLAGLEVFDPTSPPEFFRGRIRVLDDSHLRHLLRAQRWLAGRAEDAAGVRTYYLLSNADGDQVCASEIEGSPREARDTWLRIAGALARVGAVGGGHQLRALVSGDELCLYFPPPSWLERLLLLGRPRPPTRGALRVDALGDQALGAIVEALEAVLFVRVDGI